MGRNKAISAAIATGLLATGCAEVELGSQFKGNRIFFSAAIENEWQPGTGTRSAAPAPHRLPTERMTGEDLYMVPRVERGAVKSPSTRGNVVTASTMADFGVFATLEPGDGSEAFYMANERVTQASGWSPESEFLWPGQGSLRFVAYSPYCGGTAAEGVTAPPSRDSSGGLSLGYVVPTDVEAQQDLLAAAPVTASGSPCELIFSHMLAGVRFAAGAELSPCTVKSITISGVPTGGTLNLEEREWTLTQGEGSYAISPEQTMPAEAGSKYAASGTSIGTPQQIFMLMPGKQPEGAAVSIEIERDGTPTTLTASIAGHEWEAGKTVVYNISAKADNPELILQLEDSDGNVISGLETPYTGGERSFTVRSYYSDGAGGTEPVEWTATLCDKAGTAISTPYWLTAFTNEGTDETQGTVATDLANPNFLAMSDHTKALRNSADINASSGQTPFNLSSATGGTGVENTANTYVINNPGEYSIPLVYGNGIKDGAANSGAFVSTLSQTTAHKRQALFHFINHLGNEISDPYIYNNSGCTPSAAELIWEDRVGLIRDARLSEDGKCLLFNVPADAIRQGNAVVGVKDKDGKIMWSWQLWVTDFHPGAIWDMVEGTDASGAARTYELSPANLGRLYGGDITEFAEQNAVLRLTQKNVPDGMEPLTLDIPVVQAEKTIETDDSYAYYQWGRKDPMGSGLNYHYDAAHNETSGHSLKVMPLGSTHAATIISTIQNPGTFISATESELRKLSPYYCNLWSINDAAASLTALQPDNVKTVYDPCPVGMKVPEGNSFHALQGLPTSYDAASKEITITLKDGTKMLSPALGYRSHTGELSGSEGIVQWWTAMAGGPTRAIYLSLDKTGSVGSLLIFDVTFGFSVRPMKE